MKHYIYITPEGTINWIEKMPEKPKDVINDGVHRPCVNHMIDIEYEAYDRYIEHEKTDSIPFEDQYRIRREIYYPNGNDIELDKIYPIELDADIQKVRKYRLFDGVMWGMWIDVESSSVIDQPGKHEYKTFAKIIPKKEEESESQMEMLHELLSNYREHLQDRKNGSNKPLDDFMAEELEKFEIKRKPL